MESGQINAIMQVSWGNGDKGTTVCLACTPKLLARLEYQVFFFMHGMADSWPTSWVLHCPEVPTDASQRARAVVPHKLDHGECDECLCPFAKVGTQQSGYVFCVSQKTLSFSVRQNKPCRAYLKIYSLSMSHLKTPSCFFSLSSCAHSAQLLLPFLATLSVHLSALPSCEWFLKWSICPRIPIYQLVSAYIDRGGDRVPYSTVESNPVHVCAFNTWIKSQR